MPVIARIGDNGVIIGDMVYMIYNICSRVKIGLMIGVGNNRGNCIVPRALLDI